VGVEKAALSKDKQNVSVLGGGFRPRAEDGVFDQRHKGGKTENHEKEQTRAIWIQQWEGKRKRIGVQNRRLGDQKGRNVPKNSLPSRPCPRKCFRRQMLEVASPWVVGSEEWVIERGGKSDWPFFPIVKERRNQDQRTCVTLGDERRQPKKSRFPPPENGMPLSIQRKAGRVKKLSGSFKKIS